ANQVVSNVHLAEEATHARFSDKLRFVFIELPKFQKRVDELKTNTDIWLYCIKNLAHLQDVPAEVVGQIFQRLFELAQIKKLTHKEMEAYQRSVLEYDDIVDALDFERRRSEALGEKRGIALGEKRGIMLGEKRGIALGEKRGEKRGIALGEKRGIALGEKRGEKRGITMGAERAYIGFVLSCAVRGMSLEDIASLTKLSISQVQAILQGQD
ncbi:MAG: Rpn family recombination-promoting nuclease/putative transposase, partial [Prevotellaceae bacterium]|nr:Rpn family recombination-promoting nuclease/putative transposase [Prevotellaceae bacterium]